MAQSPPEEDSSQSQQVPEEQSSLLAEGMGRYVERTRGDIFGPMTNSWDSNKRGARLSH